MESSALFFCSVEDSSSGYLVHVPTSTRTMIGAVFLFLFLFFFHYSAAFIVRLGLLFLFLFSIYGVGNVTEQVLVSTYAIDLNRIEVIGPLSTCIVYVT